MCKQSVYFNAFFQNIVDLLRLQIYDLFEVTLIPQVPFGHLVNTVTYIYLQWNQLNNPNIHVLAILS